VAAVLPGGGRRQRRAPGPLPDRVPGPRLEKAQPWCYGCRRGPAPLHRRVP